MKLAAFYADATGRPIKEGSTADWAGIQFGEIEPAFIRVDDYPPRGGPTASTPSSSTSTSKWTTSSPRSAASSTSAQPWSRTSSAPRGTAGGFTPIRSATPSACAQQGRHLDRPRPGLPQARLGLDQSYWVKLKPGCRARTGSQWVE